MVLRRILVSSILQGNILKESILSEAGQVLLPKGAIVTAKNIQTLYNQRIFVEDPSKDEPSLGKLSEKFPDYVFNDNEQIIRAQETAALVKKTYEKTIEVLDSVFAAAQTVKDLSFDDIEELLENLRPMIEIKGTIECLFYMRSQDEYTYQHSMNVSIISGSLAKWMGDGEEIINKVMTAGLLHDIGKAQIPLEVLNKPGKLTNSEYKVIQEHPAKGYNILKPYTAIPFEILLAVVQHHEKLDGSGYPLKLRAEKIHYFSRIISIADIYDAITADRVYRRGENSFDAAKVLYYEMFGKLDPEICTTFLSRLKDQFIGSKILLSDGRKAEVIAPGIQPYSRPIVRTIAGEFINLEETRYLEFRKIVE